MNYHHVAFLKVLIMSTNNNGKIIVKTSFVDSFKL